MEHFLPFERPIEEVERALRRAAWRVRQGTEGAVEAFGREFRRHEQLRNDLFRDLSPWQRVQLARHPNRPQGHEVATVLFGPLEPLSGDRVGADDGAIETGIGRWPS